MNGYSSDRKVSGRMLHSWTFLMVASVLVTAPPASGHAPDPRVVFARHDPEHRLANTKIRKLGVIRRGAVTYSIYYLDFANPVSLHGLQQIAIIRNGSQFAGSYECTLGADKYDGKLKIGKDRLTVTVERFKYIIRFDKNGPTHNKNFCGWGSWDNGI